MTSTFSLSRPVMRLFLGYGVNFFGSGMTMPFLVVYLHEVRHISLAVAGSIVGASSLAGLFVAPFVGWAVDRFGSLRILMASLFILTLGTAGYAFAYHASIALAAGILSGIGNTAMWNGLSTRLAQLTEGSDRGRYFGLSYAIQNLGLGLGSAVSGFAVHPGDPASFTRIFLIDAASYLAFVPFVLPTRKALAGESGPKGVTGAGQREAADARVRPKRNVPSRGYRATLHDKALLAATGLNTMFVVFGFSQLGVSFSTWVSGPAGAGTGIAGLAFFVNCITIAIVQVPVLRLTANWRRTRTAAMAALGFTLCWVLTAAAGRHHGLWTSVLFVAALTVFGIGEAFLSPSLSPLVNDLAPESLRGRYNATFSLSWQAGTVVGPLVAGFALGSGIGAWLFVALAALCGVGVFGALAMERIVPARVNRGDPA